MITVAHNKLALIAVEKDWADALQVEATIKVNFGLLKPRTRAAILRGFNQGYIRTFSGPVYAVYSSLCQAAGLPVHVFGRTRASITLDNAHATKFEQEMIAMAKLSGSSTRYHGVYHKRSRSNPTWSEVSFPRFFGLSFKGFMNLFNAYPRVIGDQTKLDAARKRVYDGASTDMTLSYNRGVGR